ncbi:hypothetical protein GCK32_012994 [Trichostrongylus colubriformis]|uniref:Uncharacterized protein n=1 Tax=Trichostrongylus colubriformis TaxID=6319 RepID=A0AAN8IL87_TRICO
MRNNASDGTAFIDGDKKPIASFTYGISSPAMFNKYMLRTYVVFSGRVPFRDKAKIGKMENAKIRVYYELHKMFSELEHFYIWPTGKRVFRYGDDGFRQPRNPYSWLYTMFDKRARNPYSWMNE